MSTGENSQINPTQIVLIISVALLAIVGVGWFALDSDTGGAEAPVAVVPSDSAASDSEPVAEDASTVLEDSADAPNTSEPEAQAAEKEPAEPDDAEVPAVAQTVETNLRKARLAAEAEMLISPDKRSALHFYSLVLAEDPGNPLAEAELDAVLGRLAVRATELLDGEDYAQAFDLSQRVARLRPDHVLVNNVQQTVNQVSGDLVTAAMQQAEAGDAAAALATVQEAANLPGSNRDYLQAVRDSINDLLQARQEAAQAAEAQRQNAARAVADWMERVRAAIAAGRLTGDGDDSALTILAERSDQGEISQQLRGEWLSALLAMASARVDAGELDDAESIIVVAEESTTDNETVIRLRESLEERYAAAEADRVVPVSQMVSISRPAPSYPRRAEERGQSGWVDVLFRVTAEGRTADVAVSDSHPATIFNQSVLDAVEQWTFEPREYRGRVIEPLVSARLVFSLD